MVNPTPIAGFEITDQSENILNPQQIVKAVPAMRLR